MFPGGSRCRFIATFSGKCHLLESRKGAGRYQKDQRCDYAPSDREAAYPRPTLFYFTAKSSSYLGLFASETNWPARFDGTCNHAECYQFASLLILLPSVHLGCLHLTALHSPRSDTRAPSMSLCDGIRKLGILAHRMSIACLNPGFAGAIAQFDAPARMRHLEYFRLLI